MLVLWVLLNQIPTGSSPGLGGDDNLGARQVGPVGNVVNGWNWSIVESYGLSPGYDTVMSDAVIPYPISGCTPYIFGPMGQPGVYEYTIINGESLKDYSYGNYSPSTVYDINGACYITAAGYTTDVGYSIPNSYGISFYTKKNFNFRSPVSSSDFSNVCPMEPNGDVVRSWNVDNSYGRSPGLYDAYGGAYRVESDGNVVVSYWNLGDSYGNIPIFDQNNFGGFALRATTTATSVRTTFTRMVTSTTTSATMWIGIPADGALRTVGIH